MQRKEKTQRRDFLKKIPLALVSIGAFSLLKLKKQNYYPVQNFNTLSKPEADEIIKSEKFAVPNRLKPAPAPLAKKNIKA